MNTVITVLCIFSVLFGVLFKNGAELSNAAVSASADTVILLLKLCGGICFWSGMLHLCQKNGICELINKFLTPVLKLLFPKLNKNSKALKLISMNITANLLGLGNAATPIGISAIKELNTLNPNKKAPTNEMITFTVINCSSIQFLPTTLATLRSAYGSKNPMDILPCVLIVSSISLAVGVSLSKIIPLFKRSKK